MKQTEVTARFVGADGSMGFTHGKLYKFVIQNDWKARIVIHHINFLDEKVTVPYSGIVTFLNNWKEISLHTK